MSDPLPPSQAAPLTRRRWLDVFLGSSFAAWAGAVVYPVVRYLTPAKDAGGADRMTLSDEQKKELLGAGFLVARLGTERVLLVKEKEQKVRALSAKCTHEGCTVQYVPADGVVWCACHNGKFALDGRVLAGPPPRPLVEFRVEGDLAGAVVVSKAGVAT